MENEDAYRDIREKIPYTSFPTLMEKQVSPAETKMAWDELVKKDIDLVKTFADNQSVPEPIINMFWGFFSRNMVWSNFGEKTIKHMTKLLNYQLTVWRCSIPYFEQSFDMERIDANIRAAYLSTLSRTTGNDRERVLVSKDIKETKEIIERAEEKKRGVFRRSIGAMVGRHG